MIDFISGCVDLFSHTFVAVFSIDVFNFFCCILLLETGFGLWFFFNRGMKKM